MPALSEPGGQPSKPPFEAPGDFFVQALRQFPFLTAILMPGEGDCTITFINDAYLTAARRYKPGIAESEIVGHSLKQILSEVFGMQPAQCMQAQALVERAARELRTVTHEFRLYRDGQDVFVEGTLTPLLTSDGQSRHFLFSGTDISEKRRLEELHKHDEELFQITSRMAQVGGWELNILTNELRWSEEVYRVHELDPSVRVNVDTAINYYAPESRPIIRNAVEQAMLDGKPWDLELELITAKGRRLWVRAQGECIKVDGRPVILRGAFQDIDVRKRAEQAFMENQTRFRLFVESASDGIIVIDEVGRIETINPAISQMFGYNEEELIGQNVNVLMPDPYHSVHDQYIRNYLESGIAKIIGTSREVLGKRRDGSVFPMDLSVTEIHIGNKRRFTGIVRDISLRRSLEDQLRQAQKLESIGRLAGGVAHDFNNMLTVIKGQAELTRRRAANDPKIHQGLDAIIDSAQRAADVTQQLLAFGRKSILSPEVMDINALMIHQERMLRRVIGENIKLTLKCDPNLGNVRTDASQIQQAILNLVLNARDAMPNGGELLLETRNVSTDENFLGRHPGSKAGAYIMLAVSDNGEGIPKNAIQHIFEPFYTTKPQGKGTGLGLAMVHGFVNQSGGHIQVYSEPGLGTSFKIYLPRVEQPLPQVESQFAQPVSHNDQTILICEDENEVRNLIVEILKEGGFTVLEAVDGENALQVISSYAGTIHMLLTDVIMPGISGRELARRVQRLRPDIKVLYSSGYTDDAIIHYGVLDTGTDFIQKPYSPVQLIQKIQEVFKRAS